MKMIVMRRPAEAFKCSGYSRNSYYLQIKEGLQMPFVPLGRRAVGVPGHEQDAVNAARAAGKTDAEIRLLVAALVAARQQAA